MQLVGACHHYIILITPGPDPARLSGSRHHWLRSGQPEAEQDQPHPGSFSQGAGGHCISAARVSPWRFFPAGWAISSSRII